jgi:hypothetical protein
VGIIDRDGNGTTLLGNAAETAQQPGFAYSGLAGDIDDKPPTIVVNTIQKITPEEIQLISPSDKLVLTPSF